MAVRSSEVYLEKQLKVLRFFGIWPHSEDAATWKKVSSKVLFYVMLVMKLVSLPLILYHIYDEWGALPNPIDTMVVIASHFNTIFGMIYIPYNYGDFQSLVGLIDKTFVIPRSGSGDESQHRVFKKTMRTTSLLTNLYIGMAISLSVLYGIQPFAFPPEERPLPYRLKVPFGIDVSSGRNYWIAYCVTMVNWMGMTINGGIVCDFLISMTIKTTCQFKVLELMLLQIRDFVRKQKQEKEQPAATVEELEELESELLLQRLRECLKYHQDILTFVQELDYHVSPYILGQISVYLVFICMNIFAMSFLPVLSVMFMQCAMFVVSTLFLMLMFCWFDNELRLQSETVAEAAYNCDWVDAPQDFRRALVLLIWRAQKPVKLTGWKFFTVDLNLFISVLQTSYSYFQVMRTVYIEEQE
ncbi:Odorant receptor 65 [Blattella germanica]|nr:Odorant receptor 65 [Blattella germanica]